MAPRGGAASYLNEQSASRTPNAQGRRQSQQCFLFTQNGQRRVDGRRHRAPANRQPQRLRELAQGKSRLGGRVTDDRVNCRRTPIRQDPQLFSHLRQQRKDLRSDMLAHRLVVEGCRRTKEKHAVGRHFLHRFGAFALCGHDELELRVVVRGDAHLRQMQRSGSTKRDAGARIMCC